MTFRSLIATLAMVVAVASAEAAQPKRAEGSRFVVKVGDELPHFAFRTYGGDESDTDFLRGQVTLIQFAASWCTLSRDQLRDTELFARQMSADDRFGVLIVDVEDMAADTTLFLNRSAEDGLTMPATYDQDDRIYNLFATPHGSVTRTIVSDQQGRIVYLSDTYSRKQFKKTKKFIQKILAR